MIKKFDFLVIGSGIAGMSFALKVAQKGTVALICKTELEEANTYFAQGGVASVTNLQVDNFEKHIEDTMIAGDWISDRAAVEKVVKDSLGNETKEYGYRFNVKPNAEIAKNLKGHLMLVTGDMDKNVNPAHTYRMAQALIEAGKDFDMLVIPGAGHGYGSADKYFEKKMYRFFAKHLLGDTRADYWGDINRNK